MKFRKKPVVIEAIQIPIQTDSNQFHAVWRFCAQRCGTRPFWSNNDGGITISTLEGNMKAKPGDWLICGVKGELYPCKPDIFEQTYEAVE